MKTLRVFNRQKTRAISGPLLRQLARWLLDDPLAWQNYEIAVHLVSADEMADLHQKFLQIPGSTDVITFHYSENCGEIFISVPDAVAQAKKFHCSWQDEVARYLVHGLLHLAGFDDIQPKLRAAMKRRENKLLKELSLRFVLRKLDRSNNA